MSSFQAGEWYDPIYILKTSLWLMSDWKASGIEADQGRSSRAREKWTELFYIVSGIDVMN